MKDYVYFKSLLKCLMGLKRSIAISLSLYILSNQFPLLIYYCFGIMIDAFIPDKNTKALLLSGAIIAFLALINAIISYYKGIVQGKILQQFNHNVRKNIFYHIQSIDYRDFTKIKFAELNTHIMQDIEILSSIIFIRLMDSLSQGIFFITALIILLKINVALTIAFFFMMSAFYFLILKLKNIMGKKFSQFAQARTDLNIVIDDITSGMETIRAYNAHTYFSTRLRYFNGLYIRKWLTANIFSPGIQSSIEIGILFSYLITFISVSGLLQRQAITYGGIILFLTYMPQLWERFRPITDFYSTLQEAKVYLRRVFGIITYGHIAKEKRDSIDCCVKENMPPIFIDNIRFSYTPESYVFNNFSLSIEDVGFYCLSGKSGTGKSTLFNLILGLYELESGEIHIYGKNVKNYSGTDLNRVVGIVHQETFLINDTVMNNIRMGDIFISEDIVLKTSVETGFHKYIVRLEKGYSTLIGEKGRSISFGLRRMITILRVLCRKPKILLLDEITSNVDSDTECLIYQLLVKLSKEKICLMITHREKDLLHAKMIFYIGN